MSINVKTRRRAQASIGNRILRMRDLRERFGGISASHIYAMVAAGRFPKPFPIIPGGRATGWFESTIDAYLANGASTAALAEPDAIAAKYNELLMAVGHKYPGETRHETALRYITQAEQRITVADQAKEVKP